MPFHICQADNKCPVGREESELAHAAGGNVRCAAVLENVQHLLALQNVAHRITIPSSIPARLRVVYPRERQMCPQNAHAKPLMATEKLTHLYAHWLVSEHIKILCSLNGILFHKKTEQTTTYVTV